MKYKIILPIIICAFIFGIYALLEYIKYENFIENYNAKNYDAILKNASENSPEMLHNYGMSALEQFKENNLSELDDLVLANSYFSGSLQKGENEKTRFQYELTQMLLDLFKSQEENQEENQQQQEEKGQGQEGNESTENQQGDGEGEESSGDQAQNARDSEYFLEQGEEIKPLSESEQEALQESIENLKYDQMRNQQYYGKQDQLTPFQEAFDSVFGDVDRGGEKDW